MHITPEMCRAAYEYLRTTPPFKRWKLPDGDEVEFFVDLQKKPRHKDQLVAHIDYFKDGRFRITVTLWNDTTDLLMHTMAHEMCHMRQAVLKPMDRNGSYGHGKDFQKMADQVCRQHGFNRDLF
jgi:hypothetical protein